MDHLGNYVKKPYTKYRKNIEIIVKEGWRKKRINCILDIDVTNALNIIKKYKDKEGFKISFTGWVIKCVAQTMSEYKEFNCYRNGNSKILIFDDVDVAIPVERSFDGKTRPMAYILRKANEKSVIEITNEIRAVQTQQIDESTQVLGEKISKFEKFALNAPIFLKKFIIWLLNDNAKLKKKHFGTTGVTAIGMKGYFPGWVIPLGGMATTLFVVGGITKKPGVVNNKIKIREYLHFTFTADHELIDGGPLVRFTERLVNLMENGFGLS
jgi:pyruvate/2-oxoglutarate dehydrogenase complex dihydrolipoamide acyltransferase (E2) component